MNKYLEKIASMAMAKGIIKSLEGKSTTGVGFKGYITSGKSGHILPDIKSKPGQQFLKAINKMSIKVFNSNFEGQRTASFLKSHKDSLQRLKRFGFRKDSLPGVRKEVLGRSK